MSNYPVIQEGRKRASQEHPFTEAERSSAQHRVIEKVRLWHSAHTPSNQTETLQGLVIMQKADDKLKEALMDLDSEFRSEVPSSPNPPEQTRPMFWPRSRRA